MNISIGGYSFYNTFLEGKMDVFGYLETVKYRYRMDAVDLWNGFFIDRSDSVYKLVDKSYIRKIREALDEKEMRVVNFAVDGAQLWDPDPDLRQRLYENALVHLDAAEILGAETVRIDTGGSYKGSEPMTDEQFEYTVKRYREYADRARMAVIPLVRRIIWARRASTRNETACRGSPSSCFWFSASSWQMEGR